MKPKKMEKLEGPFKVYDDFNITDANGHVCTCDEDWMAEQICKALNDDNKLNRVYHDALSCLHSTGRYPDGYRKPFTRGAETDVDWLEKRPRS